MIEMKLETEAVGEEVSPEHPEDVECRACLQRFDYEAGLVDMFQAWEPPWNGMGESIAQDLVQIANVVITPADSYSKLICQFCHQKLLEACSFVVNVRINDRLLRQRAETLNEQEHTWPKPIQVDRNINSNVFNTAMDIEIKQEVVSEDETYPSGVEETYNHGTDVSEGTDNTFNNMEIKIEPEEIMQPTPFQIMVNETSTPRKNKPIRSPRRMPLDKNITKGKRAGKSLRGTAKAYAVPPAALNKYAKTTKNATGDISNDRTYNRPYIFSNAQEIELVDYLLIARKLYHGLTPTIVRQFAYQHAKGNVNTYSQAWAKHEAATHDWFYGFMNRHKNITMRVPEVASLSHDYRNVGSFFENLKLLLEQHNFRPDHIWNVDETAMTTIYKPNESEFFNPRSKVTFGETITVCSAINASGSCLPPFIVFPRKSFQKKLLDGGLPGMEGGAHQSGCMTGTTFLQFLKFFVKHVCCSKNNPCLMILDSHKSHITIDSITFCKDNGIELLTTPLSTSQKLQPLSPIFMQMRLHYSFTCGEWIKSHRGKSLTIYNFAECLGKIYPKVMTPNNIQSSFAKIGICPFDPSLLILV